MKHRALLSLLYFKAKLNIHKYSVLMATTHDAMVPLIGPHLSITKGYTSMVKTAIQYGANVFQIFTKSPQSREQYKAKFDPESEDAQEAAALIAGNHIQGFIHAQYTINLINQGPNSKGTKSLIDDIRVADHLGLRGTIFHVGSNTKDILAPLQPIADAMIHVLEQTKGHKAKLIIENQAKAGKKICTSLEEIAQLIALIPKALRKRIGVCIDTQHLTTTGIYALGDPKGFKQFIDDFSNLIGLEYLTCFHLNDAKSLTADRHEDLLRGLLYGQRPRGLMDLTKFCTAASIPMILETSGSNDSHPAQIEIVRTLASSPTSKLKSIVLTYLNLKQ